MNPIKRPIRINRPEQTIFVSKPFLKRANLYGTEESKMLEEVRAAYPNFKVVPRSIAKSNKKRPYLRVSYAYMERYISSHENAEKRMKDIKRFASVPNAMVIMDGLAQRKNSFVGGSFSKISESIISSKQKIRLRLLRTQ